MKNDNLWKLCVYLGGGDSRSICGPHDVMLEAMSSLETSLGQEAVSPTWRAEGWMDSVDRCDCQIMVVLDEVTSAMLIKY